MTALAWVLSEALRARIPYGGFPWVRLAFSQADSPMGRLAARGGRARGHLRRGARRGPARRSSIRYAVRRRHGGPRSAAARPSGSRPWSPRACSCALPTDGPTARILAVQGNVPRPGLDFNAERRQVLDNHVAATLAALDSAQAGAPRPDLVVWPENASDIDPTRNPDADEQIMRATDAAGCPCILGAAARRARAATSPTSR